MTKHRSRRRRRSESTPRARTTVVAVLSLAAPIACRRGAPAPTPSHQGAPHSAVPAAMAGSTGANAPPAGGTQAAPHAPAPAALAAAALGQRNTCAVLHPPHDVGRRANVTSLTLAMHHAQGARYVLSWTVPPLYAHGGDDLAALDLGPEGLGATVLDPEEPSNARGLVRSPTNVYRAFTAPSNGGITTVTDQLSRDDDGNELVEAGSFSVQSATVDPGSDDMVARRIVPGAPFFARTAYAVEEPFVLGLRTAANADGPGDSVSFFAVRGNAPPESHEGDFWPLALPDPAAVRRAPNPAAALRELSPEGLEVVELPESGYGVVFRYRDQLQLGWLDRALRPVGALRPIDAGAVAPGRPRIATDGLQVLVLFASRPEAAPDARTQAAPQRAGDAGAAAAGPYALYWLRARFGADPDGVARRLPTELPGGDGIDVFAPAPASLADGTWAVAWTSGVVEPQRATDQQQVWLRWYSADLEPRSAALLLSGTETMSDPRLVQQDGGLLVAMAHGRSSPRSVAVGYARCAEPTTATPPPSTPGAAAPASPSPTGSVPTP